MAKFFEVSESTINLCKVEHSEFSDAARREKLGADANVATAFHKRAIGYRFTERTMENGKEVKTVEKEMPPDSGAALNGLKNRQPSKWRDKVEVINTNLNYNSTDLSEDEIRKISALLEADC